MASTIIWAAAALALLGTQGAAAIDLSAADAAARPLAGIAPPGWSAGEIERYIPENLYDKINGRSELYMQYSVKAMAFVSFSHPDLERAFVDVFLYDMQTPLSAFGVYSMEHEDGATPIALGRGGYRQGNDRFFWKGGFYATVQASGGDAAVQEAAELVARRLAETLPDDGGEVWGFDALPKERLIPESYQYYMNDAMSLDFMGNTFTARYEAEGGEVTLFLSRQPDAAKASETFDRFVQYLDKYAKEREIAEGVVSADLGAGYFDAVFASGRYVGGATAVQGRARAVSSAAAFLKHVAELK